METETETKTKTVRDRHRDAMKFITHEYAFVHVTTSDKPEWSILNSTFQ